MKNLTGKLKDFIPITRLFFDLINNHPQPLLGNEGGIAKSSHGERKIPPPDKSYYEKSQKKYLEKH